MSRRIIDIRDEKAHESLIRRSITINCRNGVRERVEWRPILRIIGNVYEGCVNVHGVADGEHIPERTRRCLKSMS